ncbi:T9SS type A sorting domain-containing protein [Sediminibacter sp. Hel_I_10]|uniref:pectate lyase family protein n=1 Tax=Sediminibacter sp. Hel_I_10 TaxID=1392490 RepID=UPI000479EB35|nr:T9SS type A sorting domain-containing protein [Sediminibacter sp. Hel_I_10]
MKNVIIVACVFLGSLKLAFSQTVSITEVVGWTETAYIKWQPLPEADSYNVYYTGAGITDQIIDTQLIRSYGDYYRADILGLAAGDYTFKIVPIITASEGDETVSNAVTVLSHDRNGFAHHDGHIPGAYNLDGTLKTDAVVLYITENSKNTISLDVLGATTNPCVGLQTILDGFKKGDDDRPLSVRLIGNITDLDYMLNGDLVIENENNVNGSITFEGVGDDALANGWGLRIKKGTNIEVRNLGFMLTNANEGDNLGLQQDNAHVWIHNCDMFYGAAGGDADQAKGDGALDCKKSTYVTMSYNHFWDTGKSNLLGLSENTTTDLYVTYHHNWYDHSDSRHPRVRFYSAHIYNNYFDGNAKYGSGSTNGSSLFVEGNYFRNCKYPMLISQQGTDVYNGSQGTFSGEDGGIIKAFDNYITGETLFIPYNSTSAAEQFDAYLASTRSENLDASINSYQGGNVYNNFDTDDNLYINTLIIDSPTEAKDNVMTYSGRVSGGDIDWTFDNSIDDTDYGVNVGLLEVLSSYTSSLVFVQGESNGSGTTQTLDIPDNNEQYVNEGDAISEMTFTWGGDATTATVSGLPSSGISYITDTNAKTVVVSGIPTSNVTFTVTTVGDTGTSVSGSGSIFINGLATGDEIHNFTTSALESNFYTFTNANINSNPGSTTYNGLTLTERLKIESTTNIAYTSTAPSTLTLVFDPTFNGTIKLDNVPYDATAGVLTIDNVSIGTHNITKGNVANVYYMETAYASLGINGNSTVQKIIMHPNPVKDILYLSLPNQQIENIYIYTIKGELIKSFKGYSTPLDLSSLGSGSYLIEVKTDLGSISRKLLKL